jgi:hypothetical protein
MTQQELRAELSLSGGLHENASRCRVGRNLGRL